MNDSPSPSLPYSEDAERGLLSCFLQNPVELLGDAQQAIPADAFHHPGHQQLFVEMLAYNARADAKPLDLVTFSAHLINRQLMDKLGGPAMLAELLNFVPTHAHYPYYKGIMLDKAKLRRIIAVCTEGIQSAYEYQESPDDVLAAISTKIMALELHAEKHTPIKELVSRAIDRYEEAIRNKGKLRGISTGFSVLDSYTGGLQPGHFWVVGGATSDGKSAYVEQIMLHAGKQGEPGAIYTFEMSDDENVDRFFGQESQVGSDEFLRGSFTREDQQKLFAASRVIASLPIQIRDVSGMKKAALLADMRVLKRKHGIKVFAIDYGQLVAPDGKEHSREREIAILSAEVKAAAKQMKATVIFVSQLNDDGKLRESRAPGFDADKALRLRVPRLDDEDENSEFDDSRRVVLLDKNRGGQRFKRIGYDFLGKTFTFANEREIVKKKKEAEEPKRRTPYKE